jgi:hypothetical protein
MKGRILIFGILFLLTVSGVYAAEGKPFYEKDLVMGANLVELIQMAGWASAAVFAWMFRGMVEGATRAWNTIFAGTFLFSLRVFWKFMPGYGDTFGLQEMRYLFGVVAAGLMMLGFIDYYINASKLMEVD